MKWDKCSFIFLAILLVFGLSAIAQQDYSTSSSKVNEWKWTPATGDVAGYLMEKGIPFNGRLFWYGVSIAQQTVEEDGYVHGVVESTMSEMYKVRVRAFDAAGNFGPVSPESDWLVVMLTPSGEPPSLSE